MSDDLDDVIDWFESIEDQLSDGQALFRAHEERYLSLAQRVAVQTLIALRPPETEAELWKENAVDFSEMVFTRPLSSGIEIVFAGRTEFEKMAARNRGTKEGNFTPITYDDVLEWVKAGTAEGGKDLSAIESTRERSPNQIAYDVLNAIKQHRLGIEKKDFSRINQRLEDWVNSRLMAGDMDALLSAVLEAWAGALFPIMSRDFEDWIHHDVLRG